MRYMNILTKQIIYTIQITSKYRRIRNYCCIFVLENRDFSENILNIGTSNAFIGITE